jgi:bacteriorhodopsin
VTTSATAGQVRPLIDLRVKMAHRTRTRWWSVAGAVAVSLLLVAAVVAGRNVPDDRLIDFVLITPTLFLAFTVVTLFAPLAAGGGAQLYPSDHLIAFPVRPRTVFASSLLLAPLNLAWSVQVLILLAAAALLSVSGWQLALALTTVVVFIGLTTVAGQAIAWWIVGLRTRRVGRWTTWAAGAAGALAVLAVIRFGWTTAVLDQAPTRGVVNTVVASAGDYSGWAIGTAVMAAAIPVAFWAGIRATAWALRRPSDRGGEAGVDSRRMRRPRVGVAGAGT